MPALLRTHRRSWGLTQKEMAELLGFESPAHVSRIEQGKRTPSTETALACTALFGVPLEELFPQLAVEIEEYAKAFRKVAENYCLLLGGDAGNSLYKTRKT